MGFVARKYRQQSAVEAMMVSAQAARRNGVIDLSLGDPDLDTDPRVIERALHDAKAGLTHYAPARGDHELLAAIQTCWQEDYDITPPEEEFIVTTSGCHAMWLLLTSVLDAGDEVIVFTPCFAPYFEQIRMASGIVVEVPTFPEAGFKPNPLAFEAAITPHTKAVIVNSPCNPTGAILSKAEIAAILDICAAHDLLYIADDIYTAYDFAQPFTAAATLPQAHNRVASIHSFSKDFCMSGWRLGYVVAPAEVIKAMLSINESNVYVAPTISQRAACAALELRHEIMKQVKTTYQSRMEYALSRVEAHPFLKTPSAQGSLYLFLDIRESGMSSVEFTTKLLEENISAIPGTAFGHAGEGFIRMALRVDTATLDRVFTAFDALI